MNTINLYEIFICISNNISIVTTLFCNPMPFDGMFDFNYGRCFMALHPTLVIPSRYHSRCFAQKCKWKKN